VTVHDDDERAATHVADVRLSFPADPRHLRLARLTASGFAGDLGFTIDEIEELRLAVDEACAVLVEHARIPAHVDLVYRADEGGMVIEGRCPTDDGEGVPLHPVAEAILSTTVDAYGVRVDGHEKTFRLVKRPTDRG
jgi:serine/threonine-protein kinase RsbW